jgi:glycosyltransferase involved in cell wall biosynthesis
MSEIRPIHILFVIDFWGNPGGTERHLWYLATHLDRRFKCSVVIFDYSPNALVDKVKAAGVEILHLPIGRFLTFDAMRKARTLRAFIESRGVDIVQTFHYKSDIYGAVVARSAGVRRIVASKRDAADYKGAFRFFLHKLVRPITRQYIAVSQVVADVVHKKEGVPSEKITVIHNGVDLDNYHSPDPAARARAKESLGFAATDLVIGMSAWFRPEKDHQLLIDAFLEFSAQAPNARLVFVGNGPLYPEYRERLAAQGLADRIKLVGAVDDVRPYLHAFDVACLVPRINEGFSNSVLEKMASALPVIVTDVGGNREAVAEGETGFVIAPGDRAALVECLQRLYRDPDRRMRMGTAARQRVERLFSLQSMIDRHARLYLSMHSSN